MKKNLFTVLFLLSGFCVSVFSGEKLVLVKDGKTNYQIVVAGTTPKNIWDGQFLGWFLKEKTGAEFPIVGAYSYNPGAPAIFVGNSSALRKAVVPLPFKGMKDQDHVVRSHGKNIVLYGKGYDADFYAIAEFLDRCLGFRFYQRFEVPEIIKTPTLELEPFDWKLSWALPYRMVCQSQFSDYFRGETEYAVRSGRESYGFLPYKLKDFSFQETYKVIQPQKTVLGDEAHTSLKLIPSATRAGYAAYPFLETKDYFKEHPEYFFMDRSGNRTDDYLCWSNPGMRQQMIKNIEKMFEALGTDNGKIKVGMADGTDACHCPECTKLAEKYGTPGAAYFDFLYILGNEFLKTHPDTIIHGSFYQQGQTQIPPKFESGKKFPRNVELEYCDIVSKTNKCWDEHPDNKQAYEWMKQAAKLTNNISVMTYYPHYGVCAFFPFCNTNVIVDNLRKLAKLGLKGNFFEFYPYSNGFSNGNEIHYLNFSDLNLYLYYRFSKYPDLDFDTEVMDFCEHVYGPAAKSAKQYHDELVRLSSRENPHTLILSADNFNKEFSYLNPDNLLRWEKLFDEMTEQVKDSKPLFQKNVADLRRSLDLTVYGRWREVVKAHPEYFKDPEMYLRRIGSVIHPVWGKTAKDYLNTSALNIKYLGKEKPLPAQFNGIPVEKIKRIIPANHANCPQMSKVPKIVNDDEAAFGYAASVDTPNMPFQFGYCIFNSKKPQLSKTLEEWHIVPGKYNLYHLGIVQPTGGKCLIWFGYSWSTSYDLSKIYDLADVQAKYDCWVSLKFPQNYKGSKDELVLCDQIILVKQ